MFCAKSTYFIRIDKMFLLISIKFTDKYEKVKALQLNFSQYTSCVCLFDNNIVDKTTTTTLKLDGKTLLALTNSSRNSRKRFSQ